MNILVTPQPFYTPEDLLSLPDQNAYELVDGRLVEQAMSIESAWSSGKILRLLGDHCDAQDPAWVLPGGESGFVCFPGHPNKVRKPDVAVIRRERPLSTKEWKGYARIPPDLAVEVVSTNELVEEVDEKLLEYLAAGVALIWIVRPRSRMVEIHRADGTSSLLREHQEITGETVLPGFRCQVADFFPPPSSVPVTP